MVEVERHDAGLLDIENMMVMGTGFISGVQVISYAHVFFDM